MYRLSCYEAAIFFLKEDAFLFVLRLKYRKRTSCVRNVIKIVQLIDTYRLIVVERREMEFHTNVVLVCIIS